MFGPVHRRPRLWRRSLSLMLATAMLCAVLPPTVPAGAATLPASPNWQQYVEGPATPNVSPVRVVWVSGGVTNPQGLIDPTKGPTTLTMAAGGPAPSVLLDYGKDVGGLPYFDITAASGAPTLRAGYSEAQEFASPTGDEQTTTWLPHRGIDPLRYDDHVIAGAGTISETLIQGGERFQYLTLTSPGTVTLSGVGIRFTAYRATPDAYQGLFVSSDDQLNRIWYAGAYTAQLCMTPAGSPDSLQPLILDGAKRDRLVFLGDMVQTVPTIATTLGANGADYVRESLALLAQYQNPTDGSVAGFSQPDGPGAYESASYSTDFVLTLAEYVRYSGDVGFAAAQLPAVQKELAYNQSLVSASTGLMVTTADPGGTGSGSDWDFYDGAKAGAVTEFNVIYYRALTEAAYLADAVGRTELSAGYRQQASALAAAINTQLFNSSTGVYDISDQKRGGYAQDANTMAVLYGVAPADKAQSILDALRLHLWNPHGSEPFSADTGYSQVISPYVGGFDLAARFATGDDASALTLMRNEWGPMVAPGPDYSGGLWEKLNSDGSNTEGGNSLAHGWSTGPTSTLTGYVLGARPVDPGYSTWSIVPHPGTVAWAQGQIPTPRGAMGVKWAQDSSSFTLEAAVPTQTSGTITIPVSNPDSKVLTVNGVTVWKKGRTVGSVPGITGISSTTSGILLTVASGGTYTVNAS